MRRRGERPAATGDIVRIRWILGGASIAVTGALAGALLWAFGAGHRPEAPRRADPTVSPAPAAGFVARRGPGGAETATGVAAGDSAFSASAAGLVEVASPVPGGGTMVDLRGRFQYAVVTVARGDTAGAACRPAAVPPHAALRGGGDDQP